MINYIKLYFICVTYGLPYFLFRFVSLRFFFLFFSFSFVSFFFSLFCFRFFCVSFFFVSFRYFFLVFFSFFFFPFLFVSFRFFLRFSVYRYPLNEVKIINSELYGQLFSSLLTYFKLSWIILTSAKVFQPRLNYLILQINGKCFISTAVQIIST